MLIAKGANFNKHNNYGETPFYIVCYNGHVPVVKLLLAQRGCRYKESGEENLRPMTIAKTRGHSGELLLYLF